MNLNNSIMLSLGMVRAQWAKANFDFSQLWAACADGTMLPFQQSQPKTDLSREIIRCLEEAPAVTFLKGGQLDYEDLSLALAPFWENSYGMDDLFFLPRNEAPVRELCKLTDLTPAAARDIYLFLLLHLQIKPKAVIRPGDLAFLLTRLETAPQSAAPADLPRLAILRGEPVRATGREVRIYRDGAWQTLFSADAPITHLCAGDGVGILAVTADGKLIAPECPAAEDAARNKRITGADAFGSHYALLCEDGTVVSSAAGLDWQDVQSVCLGLNSAAAITGPLRRVVQKNSHEKLAAFTDVKTVSTRTDGDTRHYAVLRQSGELHLSGTREILTGVSHAALCPHGTLYIRDREVSLRPFGGDGKLLKALPFAPEVLCAREDLVLTASGEETYAITIDN